MEASGCEPKPKEKVCLWSDLRDKIKANLEVAHKQKASLMQMKELLVLQNFAMLQMRRDGCIVVSMQIAWQTTDGVGTHFACQIHFLACHYQLFEQLPPQKQGKYLNRSLLNDKQVQAAVRTYLMGLSTGEVTPSCFCCMLNERILPLLRYALKNDLLLCTAWRWLVRLGWRNKLLRKGVYMDGHERPDVVKYHNNTFLRLMEKYWAKMAIWEMKESKLVQIDPVLGPGEKRIIVLFQDESSFHANEYKRMIWYAP